jgi:DNA-binding transcriptional ArsR family regulator
MHGDVNIAAIGSVLSDPGRCRILAALSDGRALPASRLAMEAGIAPSTASVHLAKLVETGLLAVAPAPPHHGRHRFFRLASDDVADVLEAIARIAPLLPIRSLREGTRAAAMRHARTCYDHLAGKLGVALMDSLVAGGAVSESSSVLGLGDGSPALETLGIDVSAVQQQRGRRPLIRSCIDWSEQRPHLAGALGAALADRLFELDWVRRSSSSRAVHLTGAGIEGLQLHLGFQLNVRDLSAKVSGQ